MLITPYMNVYLDETGNSGEVGTHKAHLLSQPFFVLAGIAIPQSLVETVRTKVEQIKETHQIPAGELKAKFLYKGSPAFVLDLVQYLHLNRLPVFVEVMDKKYFLSNQMIETAILPKGAGIEMERLDTTGTPIVRPLIAEFLCNSISDETFALLCEACTKQSKEAFEEYLNALISEFKILSGRLEEAERLLPHVELTLKHYKELLEDGEKDAHKKFLPEPDRLQSKSISLLPHIYAFNHICARAEKYRIDSWYLPLIFVHDEQQEYALALHDNFQYFKEMPLPPPEVRRVAPRILLEFPREAILLFKDSQQEPLVQVADIIAGVVGRIMKDWKAGEAIRNEYWQVLGLLFGYPHPSVGVNFVMPHSSVDELQRHVDEWHDRARHF